MTASAPRRAARGSRGGVDPGIRGRKERAEGEGRDRGRHASGGPPYPLSRGDSRVVGVGHGHGAQDNRCGDREDAPFADNPLATFSLIAKRSISRL